MNILSLSEETNVNSDNVLMIELTQLIVNSGV
jgi:hypothetical protein